MKRYGWMCLCLKEITALVEDDDNGTADALDKQVREHVRTCPKAPRWPFRLMNGAFQVGLHPRVRAIVRAYAGTACRSPAPDMSPQWQRTDNLLVPR